MQSQVKTRAMPIKDTQVIDALNLDSLASNSSQITVIFIHYHPQEIFSPGFTRLIKSSIDSGFRTLVISNSRSSFATKFIWRSAYLQRNNKGYDFGALRDAHHTLEALGLLGSGRYVVINSSLLNIASKGFGGDKVLDQLASPNESCDITGVTSSYESGVYHIQSYYYSLSSLLFSSSSFTEWLDNYWNGVSQGLDVNARQYAINRGELALTQWAISNNFKARAIFDNLHAPTIADFRKMSDLNCRLKIALGEFTGAIKTLDWEAILTEWLPKAGLQWNPSQSCWAYLLASGFLFFKRELLELPLTPKHNAPSFVRYLRLVIDALHIDIPEWSDLNYLPQLIHMANKSKKLAPYSIS